MKDEISEDQDLLDELADLRQRVALLESQLARSQQFESDQRQITDSLPVLVATAGLDGWYKEVNAAFQANSRMVRPGITLTSFHGLHSPR